MHFNIKFHKRFKEREYSSFILGADAGGTNTSIGIFGAKNKLPVLLLSFHFKSMDLKGLDCAINKVLDCASTQYNINAGRGCIAGAGVVSPKRDAISITKLGWNIRKKELLQKTGLNDIIFINDFEAIGYGINMLGNKDTIIVRNYKKIPKAPIVVIGAGTGLGKSTLIYDEKLKAHVPLPSEAGHCDFPAQSMEELELIGFIKKRKNIKRSISYEQIVSGLGIENIYSFLRKKGEISPTRYTKEIDMNGKKPELISRYRKIDATCRKTFEIFKNEYSKFAANCALDALPYCGIYIAGGIAPKNADIFDAGFVKKFESYHERPDVLRKIPIYLIMNCNAGLLGAGFAAARFLK